MEEKKAKRPNEDYVIAGEYRLLNATIHTPGYLNDSRVHEGLFPHEVAKSIFRSICDLTVEEVPITEASLFQRGNEMDFNVTTEVIKQVFAIASGAEKLDDIIVTLVKQKRKMEIIEKLNEVTRIANAKGELDLIELSSKLYDVEEVLSESYDKQIMQDFDEWFEKYLADIDQRMLGKKYSFGDSLLDSALVKGAYPGAITTIAGATGMGKSAYVLNLVNQMVNTGVPCIYISLEMSGVDTMDRLISMRCDIPTEALYDMEALPGIRKRVEEERARLAANKLFYFVEEPNMSLGQINSLIKEFKQRTHSDYVLIAIDLVTQLEDFVKLSGGMNLANTYEMAMNKQNIIAKAQRCHFLDVVQFNREADNVRVTEFADLEDPALRPMLNNIKNAQAIAERSRAVLGLFRPKYYADRYIPDAEEVQYMSDILEVQVLKQSNGKTPKLKYLYEGEVFRVSPFVEEESAEGTAVANEAVIQY
jgi:replicative DNA helicase